MGYYKLVLFEGFFLIYYIRVEFEFGYFICVMEMGNLICVFGFYFFLVVLMNVVKKEVMVRDWVFEFY